jgi:hypothetical protein
VKVPPLASHLSDSPEHEDRCWLGAEEKRTLREVNPGEIGLDAKGGVPT